MFGLLGAYWSIFKVNFKDSTAYRTDLALTLVFSIIMAGVLIFAWTAVYGSSGQTTIVGISLATLYAYFILGSGIRQLFTSNISDIIQNDITNGTIAVNLTRPVRYVYLVVAASFGGVSPTILVVAMPILIGTLLFVHIGITYYVLGVFLLEIAMGFVILCSIDFIIGCLAVYITQIWTLVIIMWTLEYAVGGGIVPLNFLTGWVGTIVNLLPFKYLIYVPTATLLGVGMDVTGTLLEGAAWCVVLLCCAALMWRSVKKDISAVGG